MIQVSNVTMRYGSKILFEDVSTQFISGRRYGLTGPNGAGKSTFMKVLTGELEAQKGVVNRPRKLGILRQDQYAFDAYRVIDTVIMGNAPLWAAMEERETLYNKADLTDDDGIRLGELEGVVGDENGYEAESDAAILLQGLDIPDEVHDRKMSELQGGQKVRVLLAQALFGDPEALLLDEPTNYLDLESVHWLQDFLLRYSGTLITISHDRHFLNASAPTPPTSITRPSSPTTVATTTWSCRRSPSAPASKARTKSAPRRSPSSTTSSPASPPAPAPPGQLAQKGSRAPRHH